jgi:phenylalanyl-tRNA synthetase beta chain
MLVSLSWLKNYVDIPVDTQTLAHDITMLGLNVEHVSGSAALDPNVVVGHVLEVSPHPNADRLRVCRVDVGGESSLEIVCGAPNVAPGQLVPVALVGAKLAGGMKIRKSKIRGVASNGMICSEIELGLGDDAAGIMVLQGEPAPGTCFADIHTAEEVLEIEVTPNRPDQLSHVGVAREIAALYETGLRPPTPPAVEPSSDAPFSITIDEPGDCYRFTGRVIRGVKVGPSPAWLRRALESVGLNSINNVVDISNYVMMELGQPTHAYDLHRLPARRMGVRRARAGEKLKCLDEEEYKFEGHELLIIDDDDPVGVAGTIGGYDTRVTEETRDLLIEAAAFDPRVVRRTRKAMNISTDASYRFERGSDRTVAGLGSRRVTELICEVAGGEPGEFIDNYPSPPKQREVRIRRSFTRRLLGLSLPVEDIAGLLARLGFEESQRDEDGITVRVPSYRGDVVEEADLVEEVARLNGYDKIGEGWAFRTTTTCSIDSFDQFVEAVSDHLCARGHTEVLLSSFTGGEEADLAGWDASDPRRRFVEVINPLTTLHGHLRTSMLPGMLQVARWNMDRGQRRLDLYSIGRVFLAAAEAGLPAEPSQLLVLRTRPEGLDFWNDSKEATDLFDIKREIEALCGRFGVDLGRRFAYRFDPATGAFTYGDGRRELINGGIVPARLGAYYDLDQPAWYAVADLQLLFQARRRRAGFEPVPEYPPSKRDLSLVTPAGVSYGQIEKSLVKNGGRLLESVQVFDVFRGGNMPEGSTAYGVRLSFRSSEGTLTDADVDAVLAKVIDKLQSELGVVLRS